MKIIWSKWWVYAVFVLTLLGSVGLLVYLELHGPNLSAAEVVEYPLERQPVKVWPLILNVSEQFSDEQIPVLARGAAVWPAPVRVVFVRMPLPETFTPEFYQFYPEHTLWLLPSTSKLVEGLVLKHGFFDGVSKGNMIVILNDGTLTDEKLSLIFAHELGHTLGLEHLKSPYVGLMSPGAGDRTVSYFDMLQFCALYPSCIQSQ